MGLLQRLPASPLDPAVVKLGDGDMPPATHRLEGVLPEPGAELVEQYARKDCGGTDYGCRGPEGHLWWPGSYEPCQTEK